MRLAIIGAGPAGLAAAISAHRLGAEVTVVEAAARQGGLGRVLDLWGRKVELSAHIFWPVNDATSELWDEFNDNPRVRDLRRAVLVADRIVQYPITPLGAARAMPIRVLPRAATGYARARLLRRENEANAEAWMTARFGRTLHDWFFRDYAESLWGVPSNRVEAEFPKSLFGSAAATKGNAPLRYVHPAGGLGAVWDKMVGYLEDEGVSVQREAPVVGATIEKKRVVAVATPTGSIDVDSMISTIPLPTLATMLFPADAAVAAHAGRLTSRSSVLVYLLSTSRQIQYNWLALYSPTFRFGRVTHFDSLKDADEGCTVYCMEAWCDAGDDFWSTEDNELARLAANEFALIGAFGDPEILDHHVERVADSHPSHHLGTTEARRALGDCIAQIDGLMSVGRAATHSVAGMAESMAAGIDAAELLVASAGYLAD